MHGSLRKELQDTLTNVVAKGTFVQGDEGAAFASEFATYCGVEQAVGVNSGLDALTLSLRALDVGPGHEVIVPAHTYIATFLAVEHVGATPVPVECDEHTYNIAPAAIEAAITSRTRAMIPVHLYGRPCDMTSILALAQGAGIAVIEDNAQAHGAMHQGKRTGSFGTINATSFYPTKNLGALGDGGMITTNSAELAESVRSLANYGSSAKNVHDRVGYNSRLDELQAAFLRVKLRHLDMWNTERREQAAFYSEALADVEALHLPLPDSNGDRSVHHLYVVRCEERDALRAHLECKGIGTMVHYPTPPHKQRALAHRQWPANAWPIAERTARTILSLPLFPGLGRAEQEYVVSCIRSFLR
jgi:dTDP-4-amino-4,6-dideoxygalactose transaminase